MKDYFEKHTRRGLTSVEVLVYSLCQVEETRNEIFEEVSKGDPEKKFDLCLQALKKRGLIDF